MSSANYKELNMAKRAEYKVVIGKGGFKDLEKQVSDLMNKGWKPLGGIAFNATFPHQSMARVIEIKEPSKPAPKTEKIVNKKPMDTADAMRMLEGGI